MTTPRKGQRLGRCSSAATQRVFQFYSLRRGANFSSKAQQPGHALEGQSLLPCVWAISASVECSHRRSGSGAGWHQSATSHVNASWRVLKAGSSRPEKPLICSWNSLGKLFAPMHPRDCFGAVASAIASNFASWSISAKGVGLSPGVPQKDVDFHGQAFVLIPCDEHHPGVEGCDYSLVDTPAAVRVGLAPATQHSAALTPSSRMAVGILNRFRFPLVQRSPNSC